MVKHAENIHLTITSSISKELKIDQSVAHNGVCLTVVACDEYSHVVTAIQETLDKTNLSSWQVGELINLERAMKLGDRLDGHIVQGHVDQIATCVDKIDQDGSWLFTFEYDKKMNNITIEKGSITVNGTSLTVVNSGINTFSVAIIPYTYEHTVFKNIIIGSIVNLEFDVVGKYVAKLASLTN
jgi:riboflavin synthase